MEELSNDWAASNRISLLLKTIFLDGLCKDYNYVGFGLCEVTGKLLASRNGSQALPLTTKVCTMYAEW